MPNETEFYGLVVCGGHSSRMGVDKSSLIYYEKEQRFHVYDMLLKFCKRVIISCNKQQLQSLPPEFEALPDNSDYANMGPMAALLTAFDQFPEANFLVVGVDYPFVTATDLEHFITHTKRNSIAAAFYNKDGFYEPLLGWYSKKGGDILRELARNGGHSLQKFLRENNAEKYIAESEHVMFSSDTMEDYQNAKSFIASGAHPGSFKY